jgi:hypothetical protein
MMSYRLLACAALLGCGDGHAALDASDAPEPARSEVALVAAVGNLDVDVLFVINDSPNFLETQSAFVHALPAFLGELESLPDGLPNLHIGVVTSDLGTHGTEDTEPGLSVSGCTASGDRGDLRTSDQVQGAFLSDVGFPNGTRMHNYAGSLADAFASIALAGTNGCAFVQPLAAARTALDDRPANVGFLRPTASLAIVVLTDQDDCSFAHSSFLDENDATLGPLATFRCTQFGTLCDDGGQTPEQMAATGVKTGCHANEQSPYLAHLADFEAFFKSLKTDPRTVMMATVSGPAMPFDVEPVPPPNSTTPQPFLRNACLALDAINPSVRLPELAGRFAEHVTESACTMDFAPAQADIARRVRNLVGNTCIPQPIAKPADCVVVDQHADGTETPVPACFVAGDCFTLVDDPTCTASGVRVDITRAAPPPPNTMVSVRCAL